MESRKKHKLSNGILLWLISTADKSNYFQINSIFPYTIRSGQILLPSYIWWLNITRTQFRKSRNKSQRGEIVGDIFQKSQLYKIIMAVIPLDIVWHSYQATALCSWLLFWQLQCQLQYDRFGDRSSNSYSNSCRNSSYLACIFNWVGGKSIMIER